MLLTTVPTAMVSMQVFKGGQQRHQIRVAPFSLYVLEAFSEHFIRDN
jgi:hypothetical protein